MHLLGFTHIHKKGIPSMEWMRTGYPYPEYEMGSQGATKSFPSVWQFESKGTEHFSWQFPFDRSIEILTYRSLTSFALNRLGCS